MNNINFTGGFLISNPKQKVWNRIEANAMPRKKISFDPYNEEGDKFVVINSYHDKEFGHDLLRRWVKFLYYPNINLKSGLDPMHPEQAKEIINKETVVVKSPDFRKYIREELLVKQHPILRYKWSPNDHIDKTLQFLELDRAECDIVIKQGITYIKDKNGKLIAKASPNTTLGTNFVYTYPKNDDDSSRKVAIGYKGDVYDFDVFQIKSFWNNFKRAVNIDLGRKRPQNPKDVE